MNMQEQPDFPARLKKLVKLAAKADPRYKVFGARGHRYRFNPPADAAAVMQFAQAQHVRLPEALVCYLTEVGDGGAGVDYGIYPFRRMQEESDGNLCAAEGETIFDSDDPAAQWADLCRQYAEEEDDDAAEALRRALTRGMLVIGTAGCTCDYVLMCAGRAHGRIYAVNMDFLPEYMPVFVHASFAEWLCSHFEKIIQGDVIDHGLFKTVRR